MSDDSLLFEIDPGLSSDDLVALTVTLPGGETLSIWSQVELAGRTAILRQFAIYGADDQHLRIGPRLLREMIRTALEVFDVDCIQVVEARRTSGAGPGRIVPRLTFRRQ